MSLQFNSEYYLQNNPDVADAVEAGVLGAEQHWVNFGAGEDRNPNAVFNTAEYLAANGDVAESGMNPLTHFLEFGAREGRAPNNSYQQVAEGFDADDYLEANKDVADAVEAGEFKSAYHHWVLFGQFEDRDATFDGGTPVTDVISENDETDTGAPSELTEALETYQAAVADKSDFLEEAAEVEAVVDAGGLDADSTEQDVEDAIGLAVTAGKQGLDTADNTDFGYEFVNAKDSTIPTLIADVQEQLAEDLQDARDKIADSDISGLQTALNALVSAHSRYVAAVDAEEEADLDAQGELAKVIARNAPALDDADFLVADGDFSDLSEGDAVATTDGQVAAGDGSNVLIAVGANGKLVAGDGADGVNGFAALLSAAQAYVDANILLESREESLVNAANRVFDTEADAESDTFATADNVVDGDNIDAAAFEQGEDLAAGFLTAKQNADAFASALEEYQAVKQLADTLEGLNDDLEAAGDAIEALGYELGEDVGTEANDLFVFTGDDAEIDLFGEVGDDLLFIGTEYTLGTDLEAGNDSALEIFFTQKGDDTVITVEEVAFGSSASTAEVVEITLNGVNADNLQFENGYVSVVEVA